jgi:hypothetical protein
MIVVNTIVNNVHPSVSEISSVGLGAVGYSKGRIGLQCGRFGLQ